MRIRRNKSKINTPLSFNERLARLLLVITVIGAIWVFYTNVAMFTLDIFTKRFYLEIPFRLEHIIIASFITSGLFVLFTAVKYCFLELSSLKSNPPDLLKSQRADKEFSMLFILLEVCTYLTLIVISIFLFFFHKMFLVTFGSITFIAIIAVIIKIIRRKVFIKTVKNLYSRLKDFHNIIFNWLLLFFFVAAFIFLTMASNFNMEFSIEFSETESLPIEFTFKSTIPEQLFINIYSIKDSEEILTKSLKITEKSFLQSSVNAIEKPERKETYLQDIKQDAWLLEKSHFSGIFDTNLKPHLKPGKNRVDIIFWYGEIGNKYEYLITNEVYLLKNGDIKLGERKFTNK